MITTIVLAALSLGDVAGMTREAVPDACEALVTGVVTYAASNPRNSGTIAALEDPNGPAVWFSGENNLELTAELVGAERLAAGDIVEIAGVTSRLGFAPGLNARRIAKLGERELPPAPVARLEDLEWGVKDNTRVRLSGIPIDAATNGYLRVMTEAGEFAARVHAGGLELGRLVDGEVEFEGVAASRFNARGEFTGVNLEVVDPDRIRLLVAPPADPFALPLAALDSILEYSPHGVNLHRRHVRGVVTCSREGEYLWLADGDATLKVMTAAGPFAVGDEVEAVGFPALERRSGVLKSATVRTTGNRRPPVPAKVGYLEFRQYTSSKDGRYLNFDGRYVTFWAKLLSAIGEGESTLLVVDVEGKGDRAAVRVKGAVETIDERSVAAGLNLRITGVMELATEERLVPDEMLPKIAGWEVQVADASQIKIIRDDRWSALENAKRRVWIFRAVAVIFALALVWLLAYAIRERASRRREAILAAERKRMAADLHDTLEQHLAGARMLLNSAVQFTPDVPATVKEAVGSANELLAHAKAEMRARIFDMRNDVLFTQGPERVLKTLAAKISAAGMVKVRTRLRGLPAHLPDSVFSEMAFIVQEAITNAIKHGGAKNIVIAADPQEPGPPAAPNPARGRGGFLLRVANDGKPFDPARALGPEAGHYGLSGMRERAKRAGIGLDILRDGRWMLVRLEVRAR